MTKWTPGKWTPELSEGVWSISCNERGKQGKVAFFCAYGRGQGHPDLIAEATANAQLIAAAPELYEALEAILKWTGAPSGENRFKPDYEKAIAALSKARGESERAAERN